MCTDLCINHVPLHRKNSLDEKQNSIIKSDQRKLCSIKLKRWADETEVLYIFTRAHRSMRIVLYISGAKRYFDRRLLNISARAQLDRIHSLNWLSTSSLHVDPSRRAQTTPFPPTNRRLETFSPNKKGIDRASTRKKDKEKGRRRSSWLKTGPALSLSLSLCLLHSVDNFFPHLMVDWSIVDCISNRQTWSIFYPISIVVATYIFAFIF